MTKDKDFKTLVHARAAETGEKYTAARERLLEDGADRDPQPRIIGLENRYTISAEGPAATRITPDDVLERFFERSALWGGGSNRYLANGARLYRVAEGVVEYATPECSTAREALCHVRAGESLLVELAELAQARLAREGVNATVTVSVDTSLAGGSHESYAAPRSFSTERLHQLLVPFLVTRQIFAGSGGMVDTRDGPRFAISPRAYRLSLLPAGASLRLLDADAPPHADPRRYRRIHVDVGDVNRSDVTATLRLATTRLVLRFMEEVPDAPGDLTLLSPAQALRDIASDPTCRATVALTAGPSLTALDVQSSILRDVRSHLRTTSATNEERRAVDQWQKAIDGLRSDPSSLGDSVEWVARRRRIERADDGTVTSNELDRLGPEDPLLAAHRVCSEEEVRIAGRSAPPKTRALTRARFIEACVQAGRQYTVDWSHLKLNDQANATFVVLNPFGLDDDRMEKFLAFAAQRPGEGS